LSDFFDTMHTLVAELDVEPALPSVPPEEIRRRGDRLRRRRIALQAFLSATVVAMTVWGLALLIGGLSHGRV
jgi:hypothetical protein